MIRVAMGYSHFYSSHTVGIDVLRERSSSGCPTGIDGNRVARSYERLVAHVQIFCLRELLTVGVMNS